MRLKNMLGTVIFVFSLCAYFLTVPALFMLLFFGGMGTPNGIWIGGVIGLAIVLSNGALTVAGLKMMKAQDRVPDKTGRSFKNTGVVIGFLLAGSLCVFFIWGLFQSRLKEFSDLNFYYLPLEKKIEIYTREIKKNKKTRTFEESQVFKRGKLYYALEKYPEALQDFETSIKQKEGLAYETDLRSLLMTYMKMGQKEKALEAIRVFYSRSNAQDDSGSAAGTVHYYFGDYEDAAGLFKKELEAVFLPDRCELWVMNLMISAGNAYARLGRYEEAENLLTRAVQYIEQGVSMGEFPSLIPEPYLARGNFYLFTEQFEKAEADLNQAVKLDSNGQSQASWNRAFLEYQLQHFDRAAMDVAASFDSGFMHTDQDARDVQKFAEILLKRAAAKPMFESMRKILEAEWERTEQAVTQDSNRYFGFSVPLFLNFEERLEDKQLPAKN